MPGMSDYVIGVRERGRASLGGAAPTPAGLAAAEAGLAAGEPAPGLAPVPAAYIERSVSPRASDRRNRELQRTLGDALAALMRGPYQRLFVQETIIF